MLKPLGKSLFHLHSKCLVSRSGDTLQLTKGPHRRPRAPGIRRPGTWRRIISIKKAPQVCPFRALVIDRQQKILGELMLDTEVPVLHVGRLHIARNGVLNRAGGGGGIEVLEQVLCKNQRRARKI